MLFRSVSPHFALSRYAEHIARAASSFEIIIDAVTVPPDADGSIHARIFMGVLTIDPDECIDCAVCSLSDVRSVRAEAVPHRRG